MRFSSFCCQKYCSHDAFSTNSLIHRYARLGEIDKARRAFDQMPVKTVVSWNSIIGGYFQNAQPEKARILFDKMPERQTSSWNCLISGYVKNRMIKDARKVFDVMPERNVVSWTAMVRGYVQQGMISEAESLFQQMPQKNVISWTVMLGALIQDGRMSEACRHFDAMPEKDIVARTNMIFGYCQQGCLTDARKLFDEMPRRNVISWTTMISGYAQNMQVDIARKLFEVMPDKNEVTWTAMLSGYIQCGRLEEASDLFNRMPEKSLAACNVMILGFGQKGQIVEARQVFDEMREKDDGSWSAMIKGYERNGLEVEALDLFSKMQRVGIRANFAALVSVLTVCSSLAVLDCGQQIHTELIRSLFDSDVFVASALITMYIKCGNLVWARRVFDHFKHKDVVMWNSMITGYAQHGLGAEALHLFHDMRFSKEKPDDVTFVGVLSACSYNGMIKEGMEFFELMRSIYMIEPTIDHYACMVDLLGRAGHLKEAKELIDKMPYEADAVVWGALLAACKTHINLDFAEVAAKELMQLEPTNSGPYILLSNLYASRGKWEDVTKLRNIMRLRNLSKSPGCSWIEVDKKVCMFTGGDELMHCEHELIVAMVQNLSFMLREAAYCSGSSPALHNVDEP